MNTAPLTDSELLALAAMANVEAVLMAGDNEMRRACGETPAWRGGCGYMPAATKLYDELYRRNILS